MDFLPIGSTNICSTTSEIPTLTILNRSIMTVALQFCRLFDNMYSL